MKLLLEFKDYNDLSFVKDTVEDSILSEIDESINIVVHQSFITISDGEVTCHDLKRSEHSSEFDFKSYLISFNERIEKEQFDNISPRIESTLSQEFDDIIKCIALQSFPINEFVICSDNEYQILKSICNFEYSIEDEIYEIRNNPYTSVIDLTTDDFNNTKSLTIWIRKYLSKLGVNLKLNRENIESNYLNYKISTSFFYNSSSNLIGRWIHGLEYNSDGRYSNFCKDSTGLYLSDINLRTWMKNNLPIHYDTLNNLKKIGDKIDSMNLSFQLDLNSDPNEEAKRLLDIIKEKVFPIFSNSETDAISNLYKQFEKLEELGIDAEWTHEGNYFYLFDINYKGEHYIVHTKYDVKKKLVKIELKDKNIDQEIQIEDFCDTIFLLLNE
jgi:hypothetical protein